MAALKPGFALANLSASSPADTSRTLSLADALNTPSLLNGDTVQAVIPVSFCGEAVPMEETSVLRRWRHTIMAQGAQEECMFNVRKRAAGFFPIIEPILRLYGIPTDFKFLPLAESELINDCVSPKGASGYWQLMPGTARELGLKVGGDNDERYDLRKATVAVCHYLRDLHKELGSWTLVAAAYNGGISQIKSRMRQQSQRNYYKLRLYRETSHYLFRVLAYKELLTSPRRYKRMFSSTAMASLTRPVPRWTKPKTARSTPELAEETTVVAATEASPTWGPRVDRTVLEAPSAIKQWLARFTADPANATDLDGKRAGFPLNELMGLVILRFRRPRFLRKKPGTGRRPMHLWEWV
ncbi:MAG: lytic transglycosylase domain-containing protein [Bacteroidetes bacterium]|nr:lytic transglycosylase domain-containing protein [Fibrella sp.]